MASIVVSGDTSGAITIAAPAVAGTNTITLPASTGTLVVTGGAQTIEFAAGTVSAPSITTTGDTNTGIFFPAADTIAFTEGGVEAMRIDSSANVGIGTTSPDARLDVERNHGVSGLAGVVAAPNIAVTNTTNWGYPTGMLFRAPLATGGSVINNAGIWAEFSATNNAYLGFATTNGGTLAERMRIDSSGDVGIGCTPSAVGGYRLLELNGSTGGILYLRSSGTRVLQLYGTASEAGLYQMANAPLILATNNTERMRIDSSGRLLINTTTARTTLTGDRSALVQLEAQSVDQFLSIFRNENNAFGSAIWLGKSRGTTAGSNTTVQSGDTLASLVFLGANGTNTQQAAGIAVQATGTISASAMPGIMTFSTTGAGSNTPTERMRITSGGNVGIGATAPVTKLDVSGPSGVTSFTGTTRLGVTLQGPTSTNDYAGIDFATNNGNPIARVAAYFSGGGSYLQFGTSNNYGSGITNTAMTINVGGEVLVGGTTDNGAYNLQCNGTGVWGAGAYVNGSDARIKDDIAPIESGLDVIEKLNPVTYRYKEEWSKDQSTQTGFIAQELLTALDGQIYVDGVVQQGGEYMSVAYQNIIPILTKAIQEQQQIINDLKARIETLENK